MLWLLWQHEVQCALACLPAHWKCRCRVPLTYEAGVAYQKANDEIDIMQKLSKKSRRQRAHSLRHSRTRAGGSRTAWQRYGLVMSVEFYCWVHVHARQKLIQYCP
jgi:hypothetical protein